jgi:hypothetical protein
MYLPFMNRASLSVLFVIIGIALAIPAQAQNQQSNEGSLLPEIDPQDIEIRSQFKARFPGLRRQPILGFDPTPRVYQIDPNRMPFMESSEQVVADLPVSDLSRPDPPAYTPLYYSSDINAFARGGLGSYISPEAQFWGVSRLSPKSYVGGDLDYSSSDGHLDNQASSFRFLNANAEYATKLSSKSRIGLHLGVQNSFNQMPDLDLPAALYDARKKYGGFNLGADFNHQKNAITGWKVQGNARYFEASLDNAGPLYSGQSAEWVYNGSVARRWAGSNVNETFTVKAGAKGGNYDNRSNTSREDWLTAQFGVAYERLFNYSTKLTADASVYYGTDSFSDNIYFGPRVTVEHPVLDILTISLEAGAEPYLKTAEQLHSANRFLAVDNQLSHSYKMYGSAEAVLEFDNIGSVNFGVQYQNISNYPIFVRRDAGRTDISGNPLYDFYGTNYTDAYKVRAYLGATHQIVPEKFWLDAKVYLQSPKIQGGGQLPYEEKIGVNSSVHYRPFDQISVEAWADYVGPRKTFRTDLKMGGFLLMGAKVDAQITDRFGAYVKLVNLLNENYEVWRGYTERPFQVFGGITVKL